MQPKFLQTSLGWQGKGRGDLFEAAVGDFVFVPAEVVAEFVEEGGADFVAVVLLFCADPFPDVGEEEADAGDVLECGVVEEAGAFEESEFVAFEAFVIGSTTGVVFQ